MATIFKSKLQVRSNKKEVTMKKKLAEYVSIIREIETVMHDEGNRFTYDLSHLPELLDRWDEYKEAIKKKALRLGDIQKMLESKAGGKLVVEEIEEEEETDDKDRENKLATPEEVLDVNPRTKAFLQMIDSPATYIRGLGQEVEGLKKTALTAIAVGLFDAVFNLK